MPHHFPFLVQLLQIEWASLGAELTERRDGVRGEEVGGGRKKKKGGGDLTREKMERRDGDG